MVVCMHCYLYVDVCCNDCDVVCKRVVYLKRGGMSEIYMFKKVGEITPPHRIANVL